MKALRLLRLAWPTFTVRGRSGEQTVQEFQPELLLLVWVMQFVDLFPFYHFVVPLSQPVFFDKVEGNWD
jgi:hypothetical protein